MTHGSRYAVFSGAHYYSAGGAANLIGWTETLLDAWRLVDEYKSGDGDAEWCHALDTETGEIMFRDGWSRSGYGGGDLDSRFPVT